MRIGTGDDFLRSSGGTLTGPLTISANASQLITTNRPDGADHEPLGMQLAGVNVAVLTANPAEPIVRFRNPAGVNRLTVRMDTGLLGSGLIPLSMLRRGEASAENAGIVTVTAAADVTIVDVALADVAIGDRVVCLANVRGSKGATLGSLRTSLVQTAGTATGVWTHNHTELSENHDVVANAAPGVVVAGVYRITGAGTLTMRLRGFSVGSDFTIAAGAGELYCLTLRDSA